MWHSIQENLKLINSKLSIFDVISLGLTALYFLAFALFLHWKFLQEKKPLLYLENGTSYSSNIGADSRPFGSKNGTTYTFSWCSNSGQIKPANKIYFKDEAQAAASGRTLSKLCKR
jgi:hypothetical protein